MKIWVVLKGLPSKEQYISSLKGIKSMNMSKFPLTGGFEWKDLKKFDLLWLNKYTSNSSKDNVLNTPKLILNIQKNYLYYTVIIF